LIRDPKFAAGSRIKPGMTVGLVVARRAFVDL